MQPLLLAVLVYVVVFGADYLFYLRNKNHYQYVSRRTFLLFIGGQIALATLFWDDFSAFVSHWPTEVIFLLVFWVLMLLFGYAVAREKMVVCNSISRTERCLNAAYVAVKGPELVFQQLAYAAIAFALIPLLGVGFWAYVAYTIILALIHTPVILSMKVPAQAILTFGIVSLAPPFFHVYTQVGWFWPAVYLHALMYVFFWMAYADWN